MFAGVGNRGGAQDELRVASQFAAYASETPDDVRDVRTKHAPVHVRLVQHHVLQPPDGPVPGVVIGQDAEMEHVRVGHHDVGASPDGRSVLAGRVAVEDRVSEPAPVRHELGQLLLLVLRQRLGRVDVQRAGRTVAQKRLEHGQVVAHALAAGRGSRDYDVTAIAQGADSGCLVCVEAANTQRLKPLGDAAVEWGRELGCPCLARRHLLQVHDLFGVPEQALHMS